MIERYCFAIDLVDDESKIAEYEEYHKNVWPEVQDSFRRSGVTGVELYRSGNRLFMIFETNEQFTFEKKKEIDENDPVVVKWETLMSDYQQPLPWAKPGAKWTLMKPLFKYTN